jgi:hypothetical protein
MILLRRGTEVNDCSGLVQFKEAVGNCEGHTIILFPAEYSNDRLPTGALFPAHAHDHAR